ncbi:MAG: hypothetical protein Q8L81_15970 [Bacteroidota bacterium]|nr:hypothetical protein [Bacteroidota bacterium]
MKSRKTNLISIMIVATVMLFASCKKEGTGGKSSIKGGVKHHSAIIANAVVYIKYGAKDFPGADVSKYDANVTCDANGNYEIKELRKGDYYLYGVGYDSGISVNVYGGLSAKLRNSESINLDIAVVE